MATPVVALVVDGAYYDVAALESVWSLQPAVEGGGFQARVLAARCAGLQELDRRLRSGHRPTEARLLPGDYLPLAPCDPDRAAYVQLAPYDHPGERPAFQRRDSRSLVGDGQPVAFPPGAQQPHLEVGLAVVLVDDLWRATAQEAEGAILGTTLMLDWSALSDPWSAALRGPGPASQLGAELWIGSRLPNLGEAKVHLTIADRTYEAGPVDGWRFTPAESLAYLSQHTPLRAGDVVGTGCLAAGRAPSADRKLAFGDKCCVTLAGSLTLTGWSVPGPPLGSWRAGG
ncbi:MAG: fumarylacetoacetate hydrolase family protein [Deltaproteobacteria bacterium]|nr:fumarylacetoacetate hydrolase family protein [Deltaproteobacteria bacterium]